MNIGSSSKAGVLYVATGPTFLEEARRSAVRLRAIHPELPVCLVTDEARGEPFWDDLIILSDPAFGFRDKMQMAQSPYEKTLFLDTDTMVIGAIDVVFEILDRFDLAGHQLFEGLDYAPPGVPRSFAEFNTGVIAFRKSERTAQFFSRWRELYATFRAENTEGHYRAENVGDQKSFRVALYESDLRFAVLGPEFNFVPHHINFACDSVRILHGRGEQRLEQFAERLNAVLGGRASIPVLDAILSARSPLSELGRAWIMTGLQFLRLVGQRLIPLALRDRIRERSLIRSLFLRNRFMSTEATPEEIKKWHSNQ